MLDLYFMAGRNNFAGLNNTILQFKNGLQSIKLQSVKIFYSLILV